MLLNLQMHLARSCQAFFGYLFSTGDVSWYFGAEQLPGYFQLTQSTVVVNYHTCGHVKESLWRDKKNLIMMGTNIAFLLDRIFLCSGSDAVSVQKKKKIFIKMKVHQKVLSHQSQWCVGQQEHWAPQNRVHSIIYNYFAFDVTHCWWGNFLTTEDELWKFQSAHTTVYLGDI